MLKVIQLLANEYKFDINAAITKINIAFPENNLNVDIEPPNETVYKTDVNTPTNTLLNIIMEQKAKENRLDIWKNSIYKNLPNLQSNNIGNVGEMFLGKICQIQQIDSDIDGTKTKKVGGGDGDGIINGKTIEIKTAHCGGNMSYQHELGEFPWHADYMAFIDVDPVCVYMTIFPNFTEEQYKQCSKCEPYFPTRSFCWRKKSGCFKLDTTEKLNETQSKITDNHTLAWNKDTSIDNVRHFINKIVTPK